MSDKFKVRDILQTTGPLPLKTVKVMQDKDSLRNCHSLEGTQEAWQLNVVQGPALHASEEMVKFEWSLELR